MGNTATLVATVPRRGAPGPVYSYRVNIDTTGADLTIRTPDSDKAIFLVGMVLSEASATNLTFKNGSTTMVIPELTTYQGILERVQFGGDNTFGFILGTSLGSALVVQSSVAITTNNCLIHVCEWFSA